MKFSKLLLVTGTSLALVLVLGATSSIYAQGRGGGRGGGMGGGRPTMSPGMDRGIDMSSDRSMDRSDMGRRTASNRSEGRSDRGMNTAKNVPTNNELNRFRGIAKKLGTTPQALRTQFLAAQKVNPNLKFGQFISANVVAHNLHSRFPNVTTAAILAGLANGHSLGQTLHNLGVGSDTAKVAERNAKEEIRDSDDQ